MFIRKFLRVCCACTSALLGINLVDVSAGCRQDSPLLRHAPSSAAICRLVHWICSNARLDEGRFDAAGLVDTGVIIESPKVVDTGPRHFIRLTYLYTYIGVIQRGSM